MADTDTYGKQRIIGRSLGLKIKAHTREWINCQRCPLGKIATTHVLWRGTLPCDVLFIGEAPGASEDALGYPFIGPAGKLFDRLLADAQDRVSISFTWAVTNILACWPHHSEPDEKGGEKIVTDVPTKEEAQACSPRPNEFIRLANPTVIISLGKTAYKYLPGMAIDVFMDDCHLGVPHPSWLRRMGALDMSHVEYKRVVMTVSKFLSDRLEK